MHAMRPLPTSLSPALLALACAIGATSAISSAHATDLLQAWQAAAQHDRSHAVARAAHAAAQPRRDQAAALWRPNVALTAAAGVGTHDSDVRGAQFSAPGMGQSSGVNFSTSVHGGTATRWALQASQPLYNPQRRVQQQQLTTSADLADVQWQAAQQALMLRTAQRFDTLNHQAIGADALDARTHLHQQVGKVGHLGLACGIFQHGFAIGQCGGHQ